MKITRYWIVCIPSPEKKILYASVITQAVVHCYIMGHAVMVYNHVSSHGYCTVLEPDPSSC